MAAGDAGNRTLPHFLVGLGEDVFNGKQSSWDLSQSNRDGRQWFIRKDHMHVSTFRLSERVT